MLEVRHNHKVLAGFQVLSGVYVDLWIIFVDVFAVYFCLPRSELLEVFRPRWWGVFFLMLLLRDFLRAKLRFSTPFTAASPSEAVIADRLLLCLVGARS